MLWGSVLVTGVWVGAWDRTTLATAVGDGAPWAVSLAALLAVGAAVVRSALVPAHRWLPKHAEAPSAGERPAARGIRQRRGRARAVAVATRHGFRARSGRARGGGACVGPARRRSRAHARRSQGASWSTSSQLGYLALQVALGISAAVVAHLVGHGVWKARKFLGAGGAVQRARENDDPLPATPLRSERSSPPSASVALALGAAAVPAAGWPALTAPADLLPLVMSVACGAIAVVTLQRTGVADTRSAARERARRGLRGRYLLGLRGLTSVLEPTLGAPAAWGTTEGWAVLAVVTGLVVVGAAWLFVDLAASRGGLPALARRVALHSLPPRSPREW